MHDIHVGIRCPIVDNLNEIRDDTKYGIYMETTHVLSNDVERINNVITLQTLDD